MRLVRRHLGRWDRGKASPLDPWGGGGILPRMPSRADDWDSSLRKKNKSTEKMMKYWASLPRRKDRATRYTARQSLRVNDCPLGSLAV